MHLFICVYKCPNLSNHFIPRISVVIEEVVNVEKLKGSLVTSQKVGISQLTATNSTNQSSVVHFPADMCFATWLRPQVHAARAPVSYQTRALRAPKSSSIQIVPRHRTWQKQTSCATVIISEWQEHDTLTALKFCSYLLHWFLQFLDLKTTSCLKKRLY